MQELEMLVTENAKMKRINIELIDEVKNLKVEL